MLVHRRVFARESYEGAPPRMFATALASQAPPMLAEAIFEPERPQIRHAAAEQPILCGFVHSWGKALGREHVPVPLPSDP